MSLEGTWFLSAFNVYDSFEMSLGIPWVFFYVLCVSPDFLWVPALLSWIRWSTFCSPWFVGFTYTDLFVICESSLGLQSSSRFSGCFLDLLWNRSRSFAFLKMSPTLLWNSSSVPSQHCDVGFSCLRVLSDLVRLITVLFRAFSDAYLPTAESGD